MEHGELSRSLEAVKSMPWTWKSTLRSISAEGEAREEYKCDCVSRRGLMTGQDAGEGDKIEGAGGA